MRRQPAVKILIIIAVGMGLVILHRVGMFSPVRQVLDKGITPSAAIFSRAGGDTGDLFYLISNIKNLARDNENLKRENHELQGKLARAEEQLQQLASLKQQLSFDGFERFKLVGARVVNYQPDSLRQFLVIQAGSQQGLRVGMEVISQGHLVGRLSEVNAQTSKVFLVTDPNFKIGAIDQQTRASGTVRGQIGAGMLMEKIAQSEKVEVGDTIVTDSADADDAQGVLIGKVERVQQQDNAVFQTAMISSPVNFNKLELVMVVVK